MNFLAPCLRVTAWGLFLAGSAGFAGDLPTAAPINRYQPMLDRSPFALATQAAPTVEAEAPGFAKDLVLTGAARLAQGEFVSIATRDQTQRFALSTGESYNGITVASVAWSDAVGKTKVTLRKGSEFGVIGYDEALLAAGAQAGKAPGAAAVQPQPPNGQPNLPNAIPGRPGNAQQPRAFTPRRPRMIPSNPGAK